jgi:hypothetical protein
VFDKSSMALNKLAIDSLNLAGQRILMRLVIIIWYLMPVFFPCTVKLYGNWKHSYFNF